MRYTEIINEANYRNRFDTATTYKTDAEFKQHVGSAFGALKGVTAKESKPQAGGAVYIIDPNKGIVGYKKPNEDSPSGFIWYSVKEPFMPVTKGAKSEPTANVAPAPTPAAVEYFPLKLSHGYTGAVKTSINNVGGQKDYMEIGVYVRAKPGMDRLIEISTNDGYENGYLFSKIMTTAQIIKSLQSPTPKRVAPKPAPTPTKASPMQTVQAKPSTVNSTASLEDALRTVKSSMQMAEKRLQSWSMAEWHGPVVSSYDSSIMELECRHWGVWELPDDADEDEEDYDWEVLSKESRTQMGEIMQAVQKQYPHIHISWQTEEKNWMIISAKPK